MEDDCYESKGTYLQVWLPGQNTKDPKPTIRRFGIKCAVMNAFCVAVAASYYDYAHHVFFYSAEQLLDKNMGKVVPVLKTVTLNYECVDLLISKEKVISHQMYIDNNVPFDYGFDYVDNQWIEILEYNFWF